MCIRDRNSSSYDFSDQIIFIYVEYLHIHKVALIEFITAGKAYRAVYLSLIHI